MVNENSVKSLRRTKTQLSKIFHPTPYRPNKYPTILVVSRSSFFTKPAPLAHG